MADDSKTDEEDAPGVHRLFEMDTKEVSLVDRGANKKKFLVVKNAVEAPKSTPDDIRKAILAAVDKSLDAALGDHVADQFQVKAPLAEATGTIKQAFGGAPSEEIIKVGNEVTTTTTAAQTTSITIDAQKAAGEVSKVGRPMNGDRLERLKGAVKKFTEALSDVKSGTIPLEKFDACARDLQTIVDECEVAKFVAKAATKKMIGAADLRSASPLAPNVGAGYQPDASMVAGAEAVFGPGVPESPVGIAEVMKRVDAISKENASLRETVRKSQDEVAILKKFRPAPATSDDYALEYVEKSDSPEDGGDVFWSRDMSAETDE